MTITVEFDDSDHPVDIIVDSLADALDLERQLREGIIFVRGDFKMLVTRGEDGELYARPLSE